MTPNKKGGFFIFNPQKIAQQNQSPNTNNNPIKIKPPFNKKGVNKIIKSN